MNENDRIEKDGRITINIPVFPGEMVRGVVTMEEKYWKLGIESLLRSDNQGSRKLGGFLSEKLSEMKAVNSNKKE